MSDGNTRRSFRDDDETGYRWETAKAKAISEGTTISVKIREFLDSYIEPKDKTTA